MVQFIEVIFLFHLTFYTKICFLKLLLSRQLIYIKLPTLINFAHNLSFQETIKNAKIPF